jgi:hypothetical protein
MRKTLILLTASALMGVTAQGAYCQGVATGGTAVPAKPLPPGMKPPTVQYVDIAAHAGLIGKNISGAERDQQYIVACPTYFS